jgi:methylated-DNA-[protein]-cysteine S-methyltransferase
MVRWFTSLASPIGPLLAVADADGALVSLGNGGEPPVGARPDAAPFHALAAQLAAYFAGARAPFDLPLAPEGTAFQQRVWAALREIPFGHTRSYGAFALALGDAKLTRAVGRANGANPIAIVVPCHRVIGSDGGMVGYAGGIAMKRALLKHEGVLLF